MDPFTAVALGLQVGSAIDSAAKSKFREAEYERKASEQEDRRAAARKAIADIDFSPGSGIYELEQQRKLQAELMQGAAEQRGDERESRALAAMEDSRRVQANMPRIIQQSEDAIQKAELAGAQAKTEAIAGTAAAEEKGLAEARKRDLMLGDKDMTRAEASFDTFTQGAFGERAARAEMNQALFSELGETAVALSGQQKAAEATQDVLTGQQDLMDAFLKMQDNPFSQNEQGEFETKTNQGVVGAPIYDDEVNPTGGISEHDYEIGTRNAEYGMLIGKDGGITEGEFSHNTNKKAVIDQESGEKEAELTGGEGILNPDQFKNLESVKELLDKLASMPNASPEIKRAAKKLKFLEGEQFQEE